MNELKIRALLRLHDAAKELSAAATCLKALHYEDLNPEQKAMVGAAIAFGYADSVSTGCGLTCAEKSGDGTFWAFEKCLR